MNPSYERTERCESCDACPVDRSRARKDEARRSSRGILPCQVQWGGTDLLNRLSKTKCVYVGRNFRVGSPTPIPPHMASHHEWKSYL